MKGKQKKRENTEVIGEICPACALSNHALVAGSDPDDVNGKEKCPIIIKKKDFQLEKTNNDEIRTQNGGNLYLDKEEKSGGKQNSDHIQRKIYEDEQLQDTFCKKIGSCRWKLAYLCFFVRLVTGSLRHSLNVAILSMVQGRNVTTSYHEGSKLITVTKMEKAFEWSTTFQGIVLSTFNVGAAISPLLLGCLTRRISERTIIFVCLLTGGVSSLLLPPLVTANSYTIFLTRGIMGLSLAGTDNVIQSMWSVWAPAWERASLLSCAYAGISVAGILTYPVCGLILSIGDHGDGWPNIYYALGAFVIILVPFWWYNAYDSPRKHPRISKHELKCILYDKESNDQLPWKQFLASPPLWAIVVCSFANKLAFSLLFSFLPFYFYDQLEVNLRTSSVLSALPHIGRLLSSVIAGYMSDWMISKGRSIIVTRKLFQSVACFGSATCAVVIMFLNNENALLSVTLIVASISFQGIASSAYRINILDISPRYAGCLSGLIGTVTNILTMPGPVVTSLLLASDSALGWSLVFLTVAVVNAVSGFTFLTFAAGEVQDWADPTYSPIK